MSKKDSPLFNSSTFHMANILYKLNMINDVESIILHMLLRNYWMKNVRF